MKKTNNRNRILAASAVLLSMTFLAGCASAPQGSGSTNAISSSSEEKQEVGVILLSVNPEIEIGYDNQGLVLEVEGKNDDGKKVVSNYSDFSGKECQLVVEELVEEIYQEGFFDTTIDGHTKNIVVKLEEGSRYPDDSFLEEVAQGVRNAVESHKLSSSAMTVDQDDYTN